MEDNRTHTIILLAVLLLGLFLRLYDLGGESIWVDEGFSVRVSRLALPDLLDASIQGDRHPPLYHLILHGWIGQFGTSEVAVRFPSAVFGVLSIWLMYAVGRLLLGVEAGLLSALVLAMSEFHIRYSQEARMYALLVLLTLASMYFFLRLLNREDKWTWVGYVVCTALLLYSHTFGLLTLLVQNAYYFSNVLVSKVGIRPTVRLWLALQIALAVLFAPWVSVLLQHTAQVGAGFWIDLPSLLSLGKSVLIYAGSGWLLAILIPFVLYSGLIIKKTAPGFEQENLRRRAWKSRWTVGLRNPGASLVLLLWLLGSTAIPFVISYLWVPVYVDKVTIAASLAFYLLAAWGMANLRDRRLQTILVGILIAFSLVNLWGYYTRVSKEQWREATRYVEQKAEPEAVLFFDNRYALLNGFGYYSRRPDFDEKVISQGLRLNPKNADRLLAVCRGFDRFWLILWGNPSRGQVIENTLADSYRVSSKRRFYRVSVFHFEVR